MSAEGTEFGTDTSTPLSAVVYLNHFEAKKITIQVTKPLARCIITLLQYYFTHQFWLRANTKIGNGSRV